MENHKDIFSVNTGFDMFLVRYVFFPNTAMSDCKLATYRSIIFLKSWICRTGFDSMSVSSRDSIWGSMLTSAYCFFSTWCWNKYQYFMGTSYIQIWSEIWQYLWPDLDTLSRLPICPILGWNSSFGNCRSMSEPGVVKGFEPPFTHQKPKYAIEPKNDRYG